MKIPEKAKIGGITYRVESGTENLYMGRMNYSGEIITSDLVIRIAPNPKERMEEDFIHELVHAAGYFMGHNDHDENLIERYAQVLYMIIKDNPDIFGDKEEGK